MKLKNYFQMGIGLGLVIAVICGFVYFKKAQSPAPVTDATEVGEDAPESGADTRLDEDLAERVDPTPAMTPEGKKSEPADLAKASDFFGQSMKQMSTCLGVSAAGADRIEPTFDNLMSAVKNELGDPILRSEDWSVFNLHANGEERRIRIETDYSDNDQSTRHLLYFKLDAQGMPSLIPLPADQTKDPSEAFIASLQKDGEVYEEEKGERAYFDNGQEMVLTEKNGKIDDMEVSNGEKTFRCAGIMSTNPNCKCY